MRYGDDVKSAGSCCLQADPEDQTASDLAVVLLETATLRSGYQLADTKQYGDRIERMLRLSMNVGIDEQVPAEPLLRPERSLQWAERWSCHAER